MARTLVAKDQEQRIRAMIRRNPEIRQREIADRLDLDVAVVRQVLRRFRRSKKANAVAYKMVETGNRKYREYFLPTTK